MSWSGIASNQCISWSNLQDAVATGVFQLASTAVPPGSKQITRAEAETYVVINPITTKASNQLPKKSDLVASTTVFKWEISYNGDLAANACALFLDIYNIAWTNTATPAIGTIFYSDYLLTTRFPMSTYTGLFLHYRPWNTTGAGTRARFSVTTSTINQTPVAC
jgi:hypothetical protein